MTHIRSFILLLALLCCATVSGAKEQSLEQEEERGEATTPYLRRPNSKLVEVSAKVGDHDGSLRNIEAQALVSFREKHNLKSNARLDLYDFSSSAKDSLTTMKKTHIVVHGDHFSMENLAPMDIYTKDATFIVDGEEQENIDSNMREANFFISQEDNYTLLVGTDTDGGKREIRSVSIFSKNGPEVHMESVLPGSNILATVKAEDYHPDYVELLNKLEVKGITSNVKTVIEGRDGNGDGPNLTLSSDDSIMNEKRRTELDLLSTSIDETSCSEYYMISVAIAYDSSFCAQTAGYNKAKKQAESVVAQASVRFQSQVWLFLLSISYCKYNQFT